MSKNKKRFLRLYLLQQSKIKRLRGMIASNPDKKEEYLQQITECEQLRNTIEEIISSVDGDLLREVLTLKYMCGKTLEEIGLILNYSTRHAERLHSEALKKLDI